MNTIHQAVKLILGGIEHSYKNPSRNHSLPRRNGRNTYFPLLLKYDPQNSQGLVNLSIFDY